MERGRPHGKVRRYQRGVSLVTTVFALILLSLLSTAMVRLMTVNSDSVAREVLSARAFLLAESAIQRLFNEIATGSEINCASGPGVLQNRSYSFPALEGCASAEVSCRYVQPPGTGSLYYTAVGQGRCGPTGQQAARTIEVQAKDL